jgi:hypothetical protein
MFALTSSAVAQTQGCDGTALAGIKGSTATRVLTDGTLVATGKVNINIDGYARAYHPENAKVGALIHLCNAGQVHLPNGARYHGSVDNPTCTGRFMADVARIRAAGWTNPQVGIVRWYGILGRGQAKIGGRTVTGVVPVSQSDGSGFYVSPTSLVDAAISDLADQARYINPLRIPAAVIPNQPELRTRGIVMGSFGVAYDRAAMRAAPFVVGDYGPAIGEATPALARSLAGQPITDSVTRANRFVGQVDKARIIWVFFGSTGGKVAYDYKNEQSLISEAQKAFQTWGGNQRLEACVR